MRYAVFCIMEDALYINWAIIWRNMSNSAYAPSQIRIPIQLKLEIPGSVGMHIETM